MISENCIAIYLQLYVMLMNDFDKNFVLTFYNSFLKVELNCDKENHVIFKYMLFSKEDIV